MNYIIVHNPKLIIELEKDVEYLEDYEEDALDKMIHENPDSFEKNVMDIKIASLTFRETHALFFAHDIIRRIIGLDVDKLLIYWMITKDIDFEIEDSIDIEEFKKNGYNIIKLSNKKE